MMLIVYAVLAAGLAFGAITAWDGFKDSIGNPYAEAQMTKDAGVLEQVKTERDAAQKQSADALSDVQSCVAASKTQTAQVETWQAEAKRRQADAAKAKAEGVAAHQAAQTAISRYQEIAARPPIKDETCEAQLGKVDKLLRDAAKARAAAKGAK
jgi:hypothetical protein